VFNVNSEIDQHDKFYLPANVQQNRTTGVGVMAPEMSVVTLLTLQIYILQTYVYFFYISVFFYHCEKKGGKCAKDVRFKQDDLNSSPGRPYPISL
jgi:hypothetical protein